MEFTPESGPAAQPEAEAAADLQGSTFFDALKEQLGLKLIRTRAPVEVLVIDHIEKAFGKLKLQKWQQPRLTFLECPKVS